MLFRAAQPKLILGKIFFQFLEYNDRFWECAFYSCLTLQDGEWSVCSNRLFFDMYEWYFLETGEEHQHFFQHEADDRSWNFGVCLSSSDIFTMYTCFVQVEEVLRHELPVHIWLPSAACRFLVLLLPLSVHEIDIVKSLKEPSLRNTVEVTCDHLFNPDPSQGCPQTQGMSWIHKG